MLLFFTLFVFVTTDFRAHIYGVLLTNKNVFIIFVYYYDCSFDLLAVLVVFLFCFWLRVKVFKRTHAHIHCVLTFYFIRTHASQHSY